MIHNKLVSRKTVVTGINDVAKDMEDGKIV
jgi:hypothetical protein